MLEQVEDEDLAELLEQRKAQRDELRQTLRQLKPLCGGREGQR